MGVDSGWNLKLSSILQVFELRLSDDNFGEWLESMGVTSGCESMGGVVSRNGCGYGWWLGMY